MFYRFYMLFILVWHWLNQKFTWDDESLSGEMCAALLAVLSTARQNKKCWWWVMMTLRTRGVDDGLWWPQKVRCRWWVMMTHRRWGANDQLWWPPEGEVPMTGYDDPWNMRYRWRVMMTPRRWGANGGLWWPLSNDDTFLFPRGAFWRKFILESFGASLSVFI